MNDPVVDASEEPDAPDWARSMLTFNIDAHAASGAAQTHGGQSLRADADQPRRATFDPGHLQSGGREPPPAPLLLPGRAGHLTMQYLRALRLNGVRRGLRQAGPEEMVQDVAARWGFWHQGQFSLDYKKHFFELPSETLNRARKGRSG